MKLAFVADLIRPHRHGNTVPDVDGVLSQTVFQGILRRERARAARNSHRFSVVAFRYPENVRKKTAPCDARFLRLLARRVRLTDAVGILSEDEVGVFLPETSYYGAQVFAQRIRDASVSLGWDVQPLYNVFCYPEEYQSASGDASSQMAFEFVETMAPARPDEVASVASMQDAVVPTGRGMEKYLWRAMPLWKRAFDIIMASLGLILAAPLMLLIALHIKLTSPGTVLFKQERVGYLGRRFSCLKFRTMHMNCEQSSHRAHLHGLIHSGRTMMKLESGRDPRIIPFGKTLRLMGLDELPQLINVLRGDMSLVGPRPCIPYEYDEFDPWHRMRTEMPPGLTGLWQVSGKNKTTFTEMIRYDIAYGRNLSVWRDVSIVLRTVPAIAGQVFG